VICQETPHLSFAPAALAFCAAAANDGLPEAVGLDWSSVMTWNENASLCLMPDRR